MYFEIVENYYYCLFKKKKICMLLNKIWKGFIGGINIVC